MAFADFSLIIAFRHRAWNHRFAKLYKEYFAVHFMVSGEGTLTINGKAHKLRGPVLWTGCPGMRVIFTPRIQVSHPVVDYGFGMTGTRLQQWMESGLLPREPRIVTRTREISMAARELVPLCRKLDDLSRQLAANAMERILLYSMPCTEVTSDHTHWLQRIENSLLHNPAVPIDWHDWARQLKMPESTFRKYFIRVTGKPPQRWLLERRLQQACVFLLEGRKVGAVADALGYRDQFYFSRQFRAWTGIAPSDFAKEGMM